jgi:hypothetical protein
MNHKERTAQVNQRGRPFDFFFDQFLTKYKERTSHDNQRGRPLDFLSTSLKPSVKKGLHKIIKEEGLLILL